MLGVGGRTLVDAGEGVAVPHRALSGTNSSSSTAPAGLVALSPVLTALSLVPAPALGPVKVEVDALSVAASESLAGSAPQISKGSSISARLLSLSYVACCDC